MPSSELVTEFDLAVERLAAFIRNAGSLFVLTGAGCSTDSGIPDYRKRDGSWKQKPPVHFHRFTTRHEHRQRYWARALVGWRRVASAKPGDAHRALARLESRGKLSLLVTQNVDRLHQRAGSERAIDLHGRLDRVRCLGCNRRSARETFQNRLEKQNPTWTNLTAEFAPDGDATLPERDFTDFEVPGCEACNGIIKPDVIFFGENVPPARVNQAFEALDKADALLVVGSSLMVWSGFRFARRAHERPIPLAVVNDGVTRADGWWDLKIERKCGDVLRAVARAVTSNQ